MIQKCHNIRGVHYLRPQLIQELKNYCETRQCPHETILVYTGHVPFGAFLLLRGRMRLSKRKDFVSLLPHSLIGLDEVNSKWPIKFQVTLSPESQYLIIDRSTLQGSLTQDWHLVSDQFRQILT